jgi:hypothetical protein
VTSIHGRRIFVLAAPVIVALSGLVGAFVGAGAAERGSAVVVFGAVQLPSSGLAVGAFAAGLAVVVLATLFGLVMVASRLDDAAV